MSFSLMSMENMAGQGLYAMWGRKDFMEGQWGQAGLAVYEHKEKTERHSGCRTQPE